MNRLQKLVVAFGLLAAGAAAANRDEEQVNLARQIFKQLIEINTTDSTGSVTVAAEALAQRLHAAGIPAADIRIEGPTDTKKNLVVRLHGSGRRRPVLFIGHLDVVEAPRVDWATDPFKLVEADGYFYGRGTQDMKSGDAIALATVIRLWKEGFKPNRDIIVALTAGEESSKDNGVKWLTEQHRDLVDAEFVINMDGGGVLSERGLPRTLKVDAAEKLYADFRLSVINKGGTTAFPRPDNAIYRLARGLTRLEQQSFPFELNPVTRAYYTQVAQAAAEPAAADLRAVLRNPPDAAAVARVSQETMDNALLHTVCSATRLEAGHANNALPQLATAMVNCRILPGHSAEEIRQILIRALNDPVISVRYVREFDGRESDVAPGAAVAQAPMTPPPQVMDPLREVAAALWPGVPIVVAMAAGESDAVWTTAAGMPTYAVNGLAIDRDDVRAHGKDERLSVASFVRGVDFQYRFMKALTRTQ